VTGLLLNWKFLVTKYAFYSLILYTFAVRIRFNGNKVPDDVAAATEGSSVAVFLRNVLFFTGRFWLLVK
jgi:hypothetical protein